MTRHRKDRKHSMRTPVILDVDTGIDDALALLFALKHPQLDLRAITCVAGNAPLEQVLANTLKILDLADADDIPVAGGAQRPLIEPRRSATHVHGSDGIANLALPESHREVTPGHAVELLRNELSSSQSPVTIVGLAPLTNIALLLRTYPECLPGIARIVIMGGAIAGGNATASAEFNIWHDPEAAAIVLGSGVPVTMYTLDAFETVQVSIEQAAAWAASPDRVTSAVGRLTSHPRTEPDGSPGSPFGLLGDAGAVCAIVAPHLIDSRLHPVLVDLGSGPGRGQTHVDRRTKSGEDRLHDLHERWPVAEVIHTADAEGLLDLFASTLDSKAATP
jgi:pyrimidine-specific ribonucleoside hydrolase